MAGKVLLGIARKFSLLALIVSVLAWILYIVFFALASNEVYQFCNETLCELSPRLDPYLSPHWVFLLTGVFIYIFAVLNLIFNGRCCLAVMTQLLYAVYMLSAGAVLYSDWAIYYIPGENEIEYLVEFGACALAVLALAISVLLWPQLRQRESAYSIEDSEAGRAGPQIIGVKKTTHVTEMTENTYSNKPSLPIITESAISPSTKVIGHVSSGSSFNTQPQQPTQPPKPATLPSSQTSLPRPSSESWPGSTTQLIQGRSFSVNEQPPPPPLPPPEEGGNGVFEDIYDNAEPAVLEDEEYVEVAASQPAQPQVPQYDIGQEQYVDVNVQDTQQEVYMGLLEETRQEDNGMYEDPTDYRGDDADGPEEQYEALS